MSVTLFWDMHSGGGIKEPPFDKIYIEAPEDEAKRVFFARFGHDPERVSCTCCGEDYSITEHVDLAQATAWHRGLRSVAPIADKPRHEMSTDERVERNRLTRYLDVGEAMPEGYDYDYDGIGFHVDDPLPLDAYLTKESVLFIPASEITDAERSAEVKRSGYVWVES